MTGMDRKGQGGRAEVCCLIAGGKIIAMTSPSTFQRIANFVIFQTDAGKVNIDVFFAHDTLWLTQKVMAELFETTKQNISFHLQNVFQEGELDKQATVKDFLTVQKEGGRDVNRKVEYYSLDAIIAVGYRVNTARATKFRIWATKVLQEFIIKGFALDDERLKQLKHFGQDYFEELLTRIREIRASERRFYQKITDIYALLKYVYFPPNNV